uniref:Uncharacterized protein n=1 Tax=Lepeophtheirus salmonis TaxID=72036 RepID=A0A0K2V259_LEPSM
MNDFYSDKTCLLRPPKWMYIYTYDMMIEMTNMEFIVIPLISQLTNRLFLSITH